MVSFESFRNPQDKHGFRMRILQKACESSANPLRILCESSGLLLAATSFSGTCWSNIDANPMRILSEFLRILWSSPRSNLFFWYKPEIPERRLYIPSNANCMYDCGCIVFCVSLALSQSNFGYMCLFCYTEECPETPFSVRACSRQDVFFVGLISPTKK